MKYIALAFFALCLSGSVIADDHGGTLTFEPRQDAYDTDVSSPQ